METPNLVAVDEEQPIRYRIHAKPATGIVTWTTRIVGKWGGAVLWVRGAGWDSIAVAQRGVVWLATRAHQGTHERLLCGEAEWTLRL